MLSTGSKFETVWLPCGKWPRNLLTKLQTCCPLCTTKGDLKGFEKQVKISLSKISLQKQTGQNFVKVYFAVHVFSKVQNWKRLKKKIRIYFYLSIKKNYLLEFSAKFFTAMWQFVKCSDWRSLDYKSLIERISIVSFNDIDSHTQNSPLGINHLGVYNGIKAFLKLH